MSRRANKIEQHLTADQLGAFNERLATMPGVTLQKIADLADEFGVEISLMAARTYRETSYEEYLAELKSKAQFAETIAEAAKSGLSMTDAAAAVLSNKLLDHIMDQGAMENEEFNELSLALHRLRTGDQRAKLLEKKLQEMEAKEADRTRKIKEAQDALKGIKSKGGLTAATLREVEEKVFGL